MRLKFDETKTNPGDKEYCLVTGDKLQSGLFNNVKAMADLKCNRRRSITLYIQMGWKSIVPL
jgi:hypothetical protein